MTHPLPGHRSRSLRPRPARPILPALFGAATAFSALLFPSSPSLIADDLPAWESTRLLSDFHAEGAGAGDIDGDGHADIAYGPFWFAGPDFTAKHRFAKGEPFDGSQGYSDNFFSFVTDANGDGRADVLVFGFPGKEGRLHLNPGPDAAEGELWPVHVVVDEISNESPAFTDLVPGGLPEIVCTREGRYGYYEAGDDPTRPWTWHGISEKGDAGGRFEHGLGTGDVDGDGHADIVQREFWYENPGEDRKNGKNPQGQPDKKGRPAPWKKHRWNLPPQPGGAQILVHDFDGDGDSDIVTSLRAHGYGLAWFEQTEPGKFRRHDLMGESSTDNPWGVAFSQLHALAPADIDGDSRMDFVTGKRFFAHQGKDVGGLQEPVLYWFRNVAADEGIEFVPHLVHRDSGVGTEITVADLDGDGRPDIVSGNKKGLTIHRQVARDQGEDADGANDSANPGSSADSSKTGSANASASATRSSAPTTSTTPPERWQFPGGRPQDNYGAGLSPAKALGRMKAPEDFAIDPIASEPDLVQPIAMCFDARGRIWVVEGLTYPERAPEGEGRDRVLIFEDSDGDGDFDSRKVFAEGLNLASGIEVGFGGVYVGAAPWLLFFPDADGDDRPDGEPEILLDGWGFQDTHETLNAFTWGPDGWLYGCHGVFTHSVVGAPGTPEEERTKINAGVWRFHPVTRAFEVFAHGTSNPWGLDFNETGDLFVSACVIPHFYHLSPGGRYQRQAGQHFAPHTYDDIKTIADHAHYAGSIRDHAFWGDNRKERPPSPADTSALGGGHAHCGLAIYDAPEFPARYRGSAFFHNLHGHRIVRERLERDGSGYTARHRPDFLHANNHDFIGVGVMQGPDGALYFSDWVDPQTCHHRDVEIWDRSNGRLYRVRHGEKKSTRLDLPDRSDRELVSLLGHGNSFHARQARRLLQERAAVGVLDREAAVAALDRFEEERARTTAQRLRAFWTRHVCGLLSAGTLAEHLASSDEHLRAWAVRFVGEHDKALPGNLLAQLENLATTEESLTVRRELASLLQRLPLEQRWKIAEGLVAHPRSGHDRNIPLLAWYGIEPLVETDPDRALALGDKTRWPRLREFLARRAASSPEGREQLLNSLSRTKRAMAFKKRAEQLLAGLEHLPAVDAPAAWPNARKKGEQFASAAKKGDNRKQAAALRSLLSRLGVRFGDPDHFPAWRELASDRKAEPEARREAAALLIAGNDPELARLAPVWLDDPVLRGPAVTALQAHPGPGTARALVGALPDFPRKLRDEAINLLAGRPDMAVILLRAVDNGKLPTATVSPALLDQFERFEDDEISALIAENWIRGSSSLAPEQLAGAIADWKQKLAPHLGGADASRGRVHYQAICGTCHQLFGEGVAVGPDLTGSNRADLGYLLENVLAPSAVVGKDYLLQVFTLKDGRTVSGLLAEKSEDSYDILLPGGATTTIRADEVENREERPQSLMPPGLFDALPPGDVADLVKYLQSPRQVDLPEEAKP